MNTKQPKTEYDPSQPLKSSRQELFSQKYAAGMTATQAYIEAGYKPDYAEKNATRLTDNDGIVARIRHIQAKQAEKQGITREGQSQKFDAAYALARSQDSSQGMIQATVGQNRLFGLEKQVIEQTEQAPEVSAAEEALYREFTAWRLNRATGDRSGDLGPEGSISTTQPPTSHQTATQEPEYALDWTNDSQDKDDKQPDQGGRQEQAGQEQHGQQAIEG